MILFKREKGKKQDHTRDGISLELWDTVTTRVSRQASVTGRQNRESKHSGACFIISSNESALKSAVTSTSARSMTRRSSRETICAPMVDALRPKYLSPLFLFQSRRKSSQRRGKPRRSLVTERIPLFAVVRMTNSSFPSSSIFPISHAYYHPSLESSSLRPSSLSLTRFC